jgi:fructokinase
MADDIHLGVDLGGTKIELLAVDGGGVERFRQRVATPSGDYAGTIAAVARLVDTARRHCGDEAGIGVGTPGTVSRATGLMKNCNSVCLNGRDLAGDLQAALGRPVRIANDANCFALSEATDGAGAGVPTVFGVILGTGVGGGLVVNGRIVDGPNGIGGEWGHNPLALGDGCGRDAPRACYCGKRGCVETFLSGPALERDHAWGAAEAPVAAEAIARGAGAGDERCVQTLERYAQRLAQALATVVNIVDPDVIVLGGGLSNIGALYELVPRHWLPWVFSDEVRTRLVPNRHGDSSGVRGAAWLTLGGASPAR